MAYKSLSCTFHFIIMLENRNGDVIGWRLFFLILKMRWLSSGTKSLFWARPSSTELKETLPLGLYKCMVSTLVFPYILPLGCLATLTRFPATWVISGKSEARAQCYCHALIFDETHCIFSLYLSESCMSQLLKNHPMNWCYYLAELYCLVWNPKSQIPWKDGLNVDPFLFFEVSIHMALVPLLFYLHI